MPDGIERIGFCQPPRRTRFKPGVSGNPAGRPRGAKGLRAELKAELDERVSVTFDGKTRRISKRRLIIKALAAKAAKGDVRAAEKLLSLIIQAEGFEDQRSARMTLPEADAVELDAWLLDRMAVVEASTGAPVEGEWNAAGGPEVSGDRDAR